MPINFNQLPNEKPNALLKPDTYYGKIESAELKQGAAPYLNVRFEVSNSIGQKQGTIFDIISSSDKELMRYKLKRFIEALGLGQVLATQGNFEMSDLAKICVGKTLIFKTKIEKGTNGYADKSVVDIFNDEIFYPMNEASDHFPESVGPAATPADTDDIPFPIDAVDGQAPTKPEDY